jgi:hypothetical protein
MQRHQLRDLTLEVPDGWQDRSITVFAVPPKPGQKVTANVVLTRDTLEGDGPIRAYADQQLVALAKGVESFTLHDRKECTVGGQPAAEVLFSWKSGTEVLQQRVVFVRVGGRTLVTFTATAHKNQFADVEPAFRAILASVLFPETSPRAGSPDPAYLRRG